MTSQLAALSEETVRLVVDAVFDMESDVPVAFVKVTFWKLLVPENVFESARSVVDAPVNDDVEKV